MNAAQSAVYATGLVFSIVGTAMWAWNDFGVWIVDALRDFGRAVRLAGRSTLVRLHLLKPRAISHHLSDAGLNMSGDLVTVKVGDGAPLQDKVAFLMQAKALHEGRFLELDQKIDELAEELRADISSQYQRLSSDNIHIRRLGVALVIGGVVLLSVTPFLGGGS